MRTAIQAILAVAFCCACHAQTSVEEWQAKAVQKYPDLAVSSSPFNKQFVDAYNERHKTDPAFFTNPQWPLMLADQLAAQAGQRVLPAGQPSPAAPAQETDELAGQEPPSAESKTSPGAADYEAAGIPPSSGLVAAKFRWWAPANTQVRGVLVLIPGRTGDGRGMAGSRDWQALATQIKFGIMACCLVNPPEDTGTYQFDGKGEVAALLDKALKTLLEKNGQALKNPPLVFWGISAGGNVSQCYTGRHPDRVVTAVLVRATAGIGPMAPGKEDVPILDFVGGKDKPAWVEESLANYKKGRAVNAAWTLAFNPREGHEVGKSQALAFAQIAAAVGSRLPPPSGFSSDPAPLQRLDKQAGWLGDPDTLEVAEYNEFKGKKKEATWLLNEATAKAWQGYLRDK